MAGHEYTHDYEVHYYDCDAQKRLSVLAVLRFLEDIALRQSEAVGVGLAFYENEQVAWLLSRWDIRIHALPGYMDTVRVLTQPMDMRRFLANRRYAMFRGGEEPVIEADSQWVFLDTARRRPARIPEEVYSRYGRVGESDDLPTPPPPREPETDERTRSFSVRMSDIDTNGHVNNIRYVEWALETLPEELIRLGTLRRLLVHYRREVHYGADVQSVATLHEDDGLLTARHAIRSDGEAACLLESFWEDGSAG